MELQVIEKETPEGLVFMGKIKHMDFNNKIAYDTVQSYWKEQPSSLGRNNLTAKKMPLDSSKISQSSPESLLKEKNGNDKARFSADSTESQDNAKGLVSVTQKSFHSTESSVSSINVGGTGSFEISAKLTNIRENSAIASAFKKMSRSLYLFFFGLVIILSALSASVMFEVADAPFYTFIEGNMSNILSVYDLMTNALELDLVQDSQKNIGPCLWATNKTDGRDVCGFVSSSQMDSLQRINRSLVYTQKTISTVLESILNTYPKFRVAGDNFDLLLYKQISMNFYQNMVNPDISTFAPFDNFPGIVTKLLEVNISSFFSKFNND